MLISHKYKFIFFKTIKTASSSVFTFFTPFCLPPEKNFKHESYLNLDYLGCYDTGIVGNSNAKQMHDKMHVSCVKARQIVNKINKKIWKEYFKFCVVRNPWDLCVSKYFWIKRENKKDNLNFKEMIKCLDDGVNKINTRQNLYKIKNNYICNYHIKYESLIEGIKEVCNICKINDYDLDNLTNQKSTYRDHSINYKEFYDSETKDIVYKIYADDIKKFNYDF